MHNEPADGLGAAHNEPDGQQRALLLDTDLFFAVKITDTLKRVGYLTRTVRRMEAFAEALAADRPAVALVNTAERGVDWRAAIAEAREANVPVIAFGSHVDLDIQEQARQAGATSVIANSKVASDLPGVVARALRRTTVGRPRDAGHAAEAADDAPNESSDSGEA